MPSHRANVCPHAGNRKRNAASGNAGFGNTPFAISAISIRTSITSITTRSNTDGQSKWPIGRIHHSTITCAKAYCRPTGQVANTKENSANKQHSTKRTRCSVARMQRSAIWERPSGRSSFPSIPWGANRIPDCISLHPGYACFLRGCCKLSVCNITRLQFHRVCCCLSASPSASVGYCRRRACLNYIPH